MKKEMYQDILSRAIPYDKMTDSQGRVLTDHGWVSDEDFSLLVKRRLPKHLEKQRKIQTNDENENQ